MSKHVWVLLIAGTVFLISGICFAASPDRIPFTIRDDFETGEMQAWEAYPYAQDIGYEPFTTCYREPAHNGSKFSLGNIRRAWDIVEVYQGFTKEIDLWTADDSRLKAAVFLTSDRKPARLEISLGAFDGSRYFHVVRTPEVNRWVELDIPVREFIMNGKPPAAGSHLQVVTIRAEYPSVSHLLSYDIYLDDFSLSGERLRRFVATEPSSTTFEMYGYSILNRHFYSGDSFGIAARAESAPGKQAPSSVVCSLLDPSGKEVIGNVPLKVDGGVWRAAGVYAFKSADPRGQWTVNLLGKDSAGNEIRWGFRFLMPGNRLTSADHPRVFFSSAELKKRLATQSEAEKKMFEGIVPGAGQFANLDLSGINEPGDINTEALTGHAFAKPGGENWFGPMNRLSGIAESGALRYALAGDEAAGRKAREALLKLCAFRMWNHPWQEAHGNHIYYPVGYLIGPVGIAYDLLYPLLSEADRKAVRDALVEKGFKQFYRDMVEMNRMPSSVTNHISVIVSNLAVVATAVYGDDPANPSFEPWLSGVLAKMKRFIDRTYYPDGGYGEPVGYENMATRDLVEALYVLERNFGVDYTTTTNVKELWRYPIHAAYSNGRMPDYGDTGVFGGWGWTGNPFTWLSYRTKNPYTASFTQPAQDRGRGDLFRWLCYHQGIETKSREEFIPSHHFPVKGHMVMRSGWSDDGSIMVFKNGPNSNHYHVDQGSVILVTNGEVLLSEASLETFKGYHAYYANPFYPFYTTQAMGHNVMLVDGDPESQMPADYRNGIAALTDWPRIRHAFAGWKADEVEGDLTCVYKGKLEKYTRSFLFIKPDVIFMYDKVKSPAGHTYNWLFHAEDADNKPAVSFHGSRVRIDRPRAALTMDILSPAVTGRVRPAERDESFVQLTGPRNQTETEFLAVLVPSAKKDASGPEKKVASTILKPTGWTGAKVETDAGTVRAFFRTGPSGTASAEGFSTDAERFAVETDPSGAVKCIFFRGGTIEGGGIALSAAAPLAVSASYSADGVEFETEAEKATILSLRFDAVPADVILNGATFRDWKYDKTARTIRIPVPAGHSVGKLKK